MDIKIALKTLGFSLREIEVYLTLLALGESAVGEIIKKTQLHRELVYGALRRLEDQGLAHSIEKKKIRCYTVDDPEILTRKCKEKLDLATDLVPHLKSIYKQSPVMVRVYEGSEGYEEIQKDIQTSLKNGGEYYVIGASGSLWYDVTRNFYKTYRKKCLKRNIHAKMVTYVNEVKAMLENEYLGFARIRVLPQEFSVPSSTKIYADKIVLQVFGERPLAIMIQSKAAAEAYKKYFNTLWRTAKPVKRY